MQQHLLVLGGIFCYGFNDYIDLIRKQIAHLVCLSICFQLVLDVKSLLPYPSHIY